MELCIKHTTASFGGGTVPVFNNVFLLRKPGEQMVCRMWCVMICVCTLMQTYIYDVFGRVRGKYTFVCKGYTGM